MQPEASHPLVQITLKIAGSEREPIDISLMPGVTAGDLLADLHLVDCVLSAVSNPNRFFAEEEVIYDRVTDGDRLWVSYYVCRCGG
jgi:hypothetical protein